MHVNETDFIFNRDYYDLKISIVNFLKINN